MKIYLFTLINILFFSSQILDAQIIQNNYNEFSDTTKIGKEYTIKLEDDKIYQKIQVLGENV